MVKLGKVELGAKKNPKAQINEQMGFVKSFLKRHAICCGLNKYAL